ncbi:uncharacterized protein LOC124141809 [Haliotis rufescens]|uniref:uncharacterized protein LOC124141809 n=1 Tax=Haliotis rufescens TaxID=6454 RepID=UPI001EB05136|nr:uncharacterized protein LOC124141809 [Haliotis rufescens]
MDLTLGLFSLCVIVTVWLGSVALADTVGGCETVEVPMCKGLVGYNYTRLPNQFNHRTQAEVYWALQPWWPFMDTLCSSNLRILLCGLYLPKCTPGSPRVQLPCRETCRKSKVRCSSDMQRQGRPWPRQFRCPQFLPKRTNRCIKPIPEKKKKSQRGHVACERNTLSMCSSIAPPFTHGSLPNMFLQGSLDLMELEMQQYKPLIQSGCSQNLRFFLCGVFMPFCVQERMQEIPFLVPCRELCQGVYDSCHEEFTRTRSGLPWPGKLHCHRYPSFTDTYGDNRTIPCTMSPQSGRRTTLIQRRAQVPTGRPANRRQPNRQGNRQGNRQNRQGNRQSNRQPNRQSSRQPNRQSSRYANRQANRRALRPRERSHMRN